MAYQDRGSDSPHFDGKNYQMWEACMGAFLHGKGQLLWEVTIDNTYVILPDPSATGAKDKYEANNKVVNYLYRSLCA